MKTFKQIINALFIGVILSWMVISVSLVGGAILFTIVNQ